MGQAVRGAHARRRSDHLQRTRRPRRERARPREQGKVVSGQVPDPLRQRLRHVRVSGRHSRDDARRVEPRRPERDALPRHDHERDAGVLLVDARRRDVARECARGRTAASLREHLQGHRRGAGRRDGRRAGQPLHPRRVDRRARVRGVGDGRLQRSAVVADRHSPGGSLGVRDDAGGERAKRRCRSPRPRRRRSGRHADLQVQVVRRELERAMRGDAHCALDGVDHRDR